MVDNTNKLNTQYNFAIPTTQEEREKIILLAVKMLTEKEGGNITLNQLLSYVDNNLNNLSNEVAQALINKSNNGHNHDDRYYTEDEVNTKVNELKSDLNSKANLTDLGMKMDLLWTNKNPENAFEPQTISLDLSKYKWIFIIFKRDASEGEGWTRNVSILLKVGKSAHIISEYADVIIRRDIISTSENSINIGSGGIINSSSNDNKLVPIYIYGIA